MGKIPDCFSGRSCGGLLAADELPAKVRGAVLNELSIYCFEIVWVVCLSSKQMLVDYHRGYRKKGDYSEKYPVTSKASSEPAYGKIDPLWDEARRSK